MLIWLLSWPPAKTGGESKAMEEGGKNSVLVYRDWKAVVDLLTDEELAKLIRHFFEYINGHDGEAPDRQTRLLFEPWRQTLDRDASTWEKKRQKNIENARRGGERKAENRKGVTLTTDGNQTLATATDGNQKEEIVPVTVTGSVSVTGTVKEDKKFNFKAELLKLGVMEQTASDWMQVRRTKKAANTKTTFDAIKKQIELSGMSAEECIRLAAERSWQGFRSEWLNENKTSKNEATKIKSDERLNAIAMRFRQ